MKHDRDIIVIGAGPAGAAVSGLMARQGFDVLLLERDHHPRHHIGESLLPASMPILAELGISAAVLQNRYQPKFGARFYDPGEDRLAVFEFTEKPGDPAPAYQVLREEFDAMLLEKARDAGCTVLEQTDVKEIDVADDADGASVFLQNGERLRARFIIDASGRSAMLAARRKTRTMLPNLGRLAVYNYYRDLAPHDEQDRRYITMYLFAGGWFWFIPLRDGRMSVGVVLAPAALAPGLSAPEQFKLAVERIPRLAQRLSGATPLEPFRAASDYSYKVSEITGKHFALIGDAAGFLDPIFSSGVHLGLSSARQAAQAVEHRLRTGDHSALDGYARYMRRGFSVFEAFVTRFYNRGLAENLLLTPNKTPEMQRAITQILAGHVWDQTNPVLKMIPETHPPA